MFNFFANPQVQFGPGKIDQLPGLAASFGNTLLLITGAASFKKTDHRHRLLKGLEKQCITVHEASVDTEPSPFMIDEIAGRYKGHRINAVAAIGGGSAIDAGKAVSAMMTKDESVTHY